MDQLEAESREIMQILFFFGGDGIGIDQTQAYTFHGGGGEWGTD